MRTVGNLALRSRNASNFANGDRATPRIGSRFSNVNINSGVDRSTMSRASLRHIAEPATEYRLNGRRERLVGAGEEINAGSKKELIQTIAKLVDATARGEVVRNDVVTQREALSHMNNLMVEAYFDSNQRNWSMLGAMISGELADTADREGFMRRLLLRVDLANGAIPRIRVRYKNILAVVASGPSMVYPTMIRNKYVLPPEFYVDTHIWIEEREIAQGTGDIMEEKFFDSQEAIMVKEDLTWKALADAQVGIVNNLQLLAGGLTPQTLQAMKSQVTQWNLPVLTMLIASDVWNSIVANTAFGAWFDPVTKYELVMTGVLGDLLGMRIISDAYRHPTLKVLKSGEVYVVSSPQLHGGYTDRGPVNSREIDAAAAAQGVPARGWYMWEMMSQTIHNPRSFCKGLQSAIMLGAAFGGAALSLLGGMLPGIA